MFKETKFTHENVLSNSNLTNVTKQVLRSSNTFSLSGKKQPAVAQLIILAVLLLTTALPLAAQSPPVITAFAGTQYQGVSQTFDVGVHKPGADSIRSLRVPVGLKVMVCGRRSVLDKCATFTRDQRSLSKALDTRISYLEVIQISTPDPHETMVYVDTSKYQSARVEDRYTTDRIERIWGAPDLTMMPASQIAHQNLNDIGAFREVMGFACMNNDDPIVYPGQMGVAHSHTFFGNCVDYTTTSDNIRNSPWTTSAGGTLNKTAVWIPTVVDTLDGTPLVPEGMNFYYKGSYYFAPSEGQNIVSVPVGLHMISGDHRNADPARGAVNTRYICYGPNGENPGWKNTITAAYADGTCVAGADFMIEVSFPICWDGVNLDSPDHKSHMTYPPYGPSGWRCPATHPVQIPSLAVNARYRLTDANQVSRWRLASDMYDRALPAGLSGHADYMMGWDPTPHPELWGENRTLVDMWTQHCLREQRDCHNYLIGDNVNTLF